MSVKISDKVWKASRATGNALLVLLAIADHADDAGKAFPSIARLAKYCRMSERAVLRNIATLIQLNEVQRFTRLGKGTHYKVRLTHDASVTPDISVTHDTSVISPMTLASSPHDTSVILTINNRNEPSKGSPSDGKNEKAGPSSGSDDGTHSGAPGKPGSVPAKEAASCEAAQAFEVWNAMAARHGLPVANKLTDTRKRSLQRRVKDAGGIDEFGALVRTVPKSEFLLGRNDRAWKASLDFICQPSSFEKLRDGLYHQGKLPSPEREWTAEEIQAMRQRAERLKAHEVWE